MKERHKKDKEIDKERQGEARQGNTKSERHKERQKETKTKIDE